MADAGPAARDPPLLGQDGGSEPASNFESPPPVDVRFHAHRPFHPTRLRDALAARAVARTGGVPAPLTRVEALKGHAWVVTQPEMQVLVTAADGGDIAIACGANLVDGGGARFWWPSKGNQNPGVGTLVLHRAQLQARARKRANEDAHRVPMAQPRTTAAGMCAH